jgi:hypothetical protein
LHFDEGILDQVISSSAARYLLLGFQLLPPRLHHPPSGLGHEQYESWTRSGEPLSEVMVGEVFTDGSCLKQGPITWHRTGWSVCKVTEDGTLQGWMRGTVGASLPQTSPAAEHVASLAGACAPGGGVTTEHSDYKGLEHIEERPLHEVYSKQQVYAGIRMQILGRAATGFRIFKVQGHADPDDAATARERYLIQGNIHADRIARSAAAALPQPSQTELQEYELHSRFLRQYLPYVAKALALWPAVGPSLGKRALPRQHGSNPGRSSRGGQASFLVDVLGDIGPPRTQELDGGTQHSVGAAPAVRSSGAEAIVTDPQAAPEMGRNSAAGPARSSSAPSERDRGRADAADRADSQRPPEADRAACQVQPLENAPKEEGTRSQEQSPEESGPLTSADSNQGALSGVGLTRAATPGGATQTSQSAVEGHDWINLQGRWTCRSCMTTSRAAFPPVGRCPGLTPSLADLIKNPRGHTLQIAPYTDASSIIVICSRCGHFAGSKRRNTKLHTDVCKRAFESDGAFYAYKRVCDRMHPTYGKGPSKVLEPCISAASLVDGRRAAATGISGSPHLTPPPPLQQSSYYSGCGLGSGNPERPAWGKGAYSPWVRPPRPRTRRAEDSDFRRPPASPPPHDALI